MEKLIHKKILIFLRCFAILFILSCSHIEKNRDRNIAADPITLIAEVMRELSSAQVLRKLNLKNSTELSFAVSKLINAVDRSVANPDALENVLKNGEGVGNTNYKIEAYYSNPNTKTNISYRIVNTAATNTSNVVYSISAGVSTITKVGTTTTLVHEISPSLVVASNSSGKTKVSAVNAAGNSADQIVFTTPLRSNSNSNAGNDSYQTFLTHYGSSTVVQQKVQHLKEINAPVDLSRCSITAHCANGTCKIQEVEDGLGLLDNYFSPGALRGQGGRFPADSLQAGNLIVEATMANNGMAKPEALQISEMANEGCNFGLKFSAN